MSGVDIVVIGPTSFVGKFVVRSLAHMVPKGVSVALAGRNSAAVGRVADGLPGPGSEWERWRVDVRSDADCEYVAKNARVIINLAGPYADRSEGLVRACATHGAHYCDLTGEVSFMAGSITDNHRRAKVSGARIVHACGFDSVPSDLGAYLAVAPALAAGETVKNVFGQVRRVDGGFSGGTLASLVNEIERTTTDPHVARAYTDPDSLTGGVSVGQYDAGRGYPRRDPDNQWTSPFLLASGNARVVRRSFALMCPPENMPTYTESMAFGTSRLAAAEAAGFTALTNGVTGVAAVGPLRWAMRHVLPAPGTGPSDKSMQRGGFDWRTTAYCASGRRYRADMSAQMDPGYVGTGFILSACALLLAEDARAGSDTAPGGVLTPATAFGTRLAVALADYGFSFSTHIDERARH